MKDFGVFLIGCSLLLISVSAAYGVFRLVKHVERPMSLTEMTMAGTVKSEFVMAVGPKGGVYVLNKRTGNVQVMRVDYYKDINETVPYMQRVEYLPMTKHQQLLDK